jgi:tRNA-modifying protein YgfZ
MTDDHDDHQILRTGVGVVEVPRDVVRVSGPDAVGFLQGQLSQDVDALAEGASAFSLLLEPQGKVAAFLRVTRTGPDELLLDTDAGHGAGMVTRLERFKLRVKADFEPLDWRCLAVRGAGSASLGVPPVGTWRVVAETPTVPGFDLLGPAPEPPEGARWVGFEAYEALRIEAGVPRMGTDLDGDTIPAAAGVVDRSVSFTKGCYTGQELVARIDSRGGTTPTRLCGVVVGDGAVPPPGATLRVAGEEKSAGALTSTAPAPGRGPGVAVALAYVRRAVAVPAEAVVVWDGGEAPARIVPLPIG